MVEGYPDILRFSSSMWAWDSMSIATLSATSEAALLAHLTGLMISWKGRLQNA
jgi:hypothetical protein